MLTPGFVSEEGPACVPALIDLLSNLKARHDLDVHAIIPPPSLRGRVEQRGLSIRGYGNRPRSARLAELIAHLAVNRNYDLVWSLWIDRAGWAGALASRILGRPLLLSVMAAELADVAPIQYGFARSLRGRLTLCALAKIARRITVGSAPLEAKLAALCPGSVHRLRRTPLGVPAVDRRTARSGHARLLAVTTLQPVKQPALLLAAIARLVHEGRDASLDIYGYATPPELDRLLRDAQALGIAERIHHRGFVEPALLRARYREYDLLLHASAYESQGMALIEAAAADLPVACFDVGVARELAALGAAIAIGTDLGEAAVRALAAPESLAADRVLARFSLARTTADFEAVLEEAAA